MRLNSLQTMMKEENEIIREHLLIEREKLKEEKEKFLREKVAYGNVIKIINRCNDTRKNCRD